MADAAASIAVRRHVDRIGADVLNDFAGTPTGFIVDAQLRRGALDYLIKPPNFLLGQLDYGVAYLVQIAILSGVYNAILTPLVFPVVRRVAESSRAKKVFRW